MSSPFRKYSGVFRIILHIPRDTKEYKGKECYYHLHWYFVPFPRKKQCFPFLSHIPNVSGDIKGIRNISVISVGSGECGTLYSGTLAINILLVLWHRNTNIKGFNKHWNYCWDY